MDNTNVSETIEQLAIYNKGLLEDIIVGWTGVGEQLEIKMNAGKSLKCEPSNVARKLLLRHKRKRRLQEKEEFSL